MFRYVIYILMFAVLGAVLYAWGLKKGTESVAGACKNALCEVW